MSIICEFWLWQFLNLSFITLVHDQSTNLFASTSQSVIKLAPELKPSRPWSGRFYGWMNERCKCIVARSCSCESESTPCARRAAFGWIIYINASYRLLQRIRYTSRNGSGLKTGFAELQMFSHALFGSPAVFLSARFDAYRNTSIDKSCSSTPTLVVFFFLVFVFLQSSVFEYSPEHSFQPYCKWICTRNVNHSLRKKNQESLSTHVGNRHFVLVGLNLSFQSIRHVFLTRGSQGPKEQCHNEHFPPLDCLDSVCDTITHRSGFIRSLKASARLHDFVRTLIRIPYVTLLNVWDVTILKVFALSTTTAHV